MGAIVILVNYPKFHNSLQLSAHRDSPTFDRRTYAARKLLLEDLRAQFYAELVPLQQGSEIHRRCRSFVRTRRQQQA